MGKITSYPDGGALTAGDKLVIARSPYSSGTTFSINYSTAGLISNVNGTTNQINSTGPTAGAFTLSLSSTLVTPGTLAINGMSAGSVLFTNGSSVVSQNNANLFWDNSNARLCLGSNSPPANLIIAPLTVVNGSKTTSTLGSYHVICGSNDASSVSLNMGIIGSSFAIYQGGLINATTTGISLSPLYLQTSGGGVGIGGLNTFAPPNSGLAVIGQTVIGGSVTADASAILTLLSTSQGFLPPSMTTTQKNAIASPATGLTVYDNVINDIQFYNGATWIGTTGSGVTSLIATPNQMTVSAATGAVTIGLSSTIVTPGTLAVSTQAAIGSSSLTTGVCFDVINTAPGNIYAIENLSILDTFDVANRQTGIRNRAIFSPATPNTSGVFWGYDSSQTVNMSSNASSYVGLILTHAIATTSSGYVLTSAASIRIAGSSLTGTGSATTGYGMLVDALAIGTARYGVFVNNPNATGSPTSQTAIYSDNISVGYTAVSPPANGAIIKGQVIIGTNTTPISNYFQLSHNAANLAAMSGTSPLAHFAMSDGASARILIDAFGNVSPYVNFRRCDGTAASPTALALNDVIGQIDCWGYGATGYSTAYRANMQFCAAEAWTDSAMGTYIRFYTTAVTTLTTSEKMRLSGDGKLGVLDAAPGSNLSIIGNAQIGFTSGTVAPTNGLIVSGQSAFGTSAPTSGIYFTINAPSGNFRSLDNTSTLTAFSSGAHRQISINNSATFSPSGPDTTADIYGIDNILVLNMSSNHAALTGFLLIPNVATTASNYVLANFFGLNLQGGALTGGGSVTTAYQILIQAMQFGTTRYGLFAHDPAGGTTNQAIYTDNLSVGYSSTNLGGTNNTIISGQVGLGSSSVTNTQVRIVQAAAQPYGIFISGTPTALDGSNFQIGQYLQQNFSPANTVSFVDGIWNRPTYTSPSGGSSTFTALQVSPTVAGAGTVNSYYGLLVDALAGSGAIVTTAYGGRFNNPAVGTNVIALFAANLAIGYTAITPPSSGAIISGQVAIGTSSAASSTGLTISNANYALQLTGGLVKNYVGKSANYTATLADTYIGYTSTSSTFTVTLPASVPVPGWTLTVTDESGAAATHNITISGNGANISGSPTAIIATNYGSISIRSNGTNYFIF